VILRQLTQIEVETEPWKSWNAYVDLLAMECYSDLAPEQRPAHLVFWYNSEVLNGGHFQYFENRGTAQLDATINALGLLDAVCQQAVLRDAGEFWLKRDRPHPQTVQEFCEIALEGEMNDYDSRFNGCLPSLNDVLETHLKNHQSSFIRII
jgi:hypothetical protein